MTLSDIQYLQFELTSHCNAKCPHCPRFDFVIDDVYESTGRLHPDLKLSHIDVDNVVENLQLEQLTSLKEIILEGDKGDPLMHPQIEKLIDKFVAHPNKPRVSVVTNGNIRNSNWWAKLGGKQYDNLVVTFSIDGNQETNHLYRVGLDFDTIIKNAQAYLEAGGQAIWKMIAFRHNQDQIEQLQKFSQELGFSQFKVVQAQPRFKNLDKWPVKIDNQLHYIEPATKDYSASVIFKPFRQTLPKTVPYTNRVCPNLSNGRVYITHENYVIPCCMMHADVEYNYPGKGRLIEMTGGFDQQDLSVHTLETILDHKLFKTELVNTLVNKSWHWTCKKSCKPMLLSNIKSYDINH